MLHEKKKEKERERKRYRLWLRLASAAAAAFPPFVYYSLRQPLLMRQGGRRRRQTATTLRSRTHSLGEWLTPPGHCCCCCCCCHSVTHTQSVRQTDGDTFCTHRPVHSSYTAQRGEQFSFFFFVFVLPNHTNVLMAAAAAAAMHCSSGLDQSTLAAVAAAVATAFIICLSIGSIDCKTRNWQQHHHQQHNSHHHHHHQDDHLKLGLTGSEVHQRQTPLCPLFYAVSVVSVSIAVD